LSIMHSTMPVISKLSAEFQIIQRASSKASSAQNYNSPRVFAAPGAVEGAT